MTRTFQDADLLLWEAYSAAPRSGQERGARILFHCLTDRTRRARVLERDAGRTVLEKEIRSAAEPELNALLEAADRLT